jgi:signal transduction histidine kinase/CheY-like chemotaxis protein
MITGTSRIGNYLIHSKVPILIFSAGGVAEEWNEAALQLFPSLSPGSKDEKKKNIRDFLLLDATEEETIRLDYLLDDKIPYFTFNCTWTQDDGTKIWLNVKAHRQEDGHLFVLIDDVSRDKLKEAHLVLAKESAEKASLTRSQFLANISHEIRTPIQTISGMMELLNETRLDEEQTEYVRQVRFSTDVMLTLINDILDFSKVEAGQMKIENIEFNIVDTIERTVDLVSMEAHKKELEILIDIAPEMPLLLMGDPGRIQQVILNLVKNAVKFTAKGQITVKADIAFRDGAQEFFRLEVLDTGIGMNAEVQKGLFTQFFQGDSSTTRKYGGTGLGLAISRNIVELMDGSIGVRNNEGAGSVFWFEIPLIRAPNQVQSDAVPVNPLTRFLLVDDNKQTLALLTRMLASLGYTNVTHASSGMFALAMLYSGRQSKHPFDIVFIDMVMPEMDGWRLAAEINKNRDINQAQLYLMVPEGSFGADAKMKLLEWFNGYLYKPIKRRMLAELMKTHWQSSIDLEVVEELEIEELPALQEAAKPRALPGAGLTVLIAEDHPVNRKLLKIFLEKAGAEVLMAEDGQEAAECMQKQKIDLVFMDIQMPRMNGYEATAWMRSHGFTQPIIACTASAQENEKEQCLSFGMNDILPKPYKRQEVIDIMLKYTREDPTIFDSAGFFEIMMGDVDSGKILVGEFLDQTEMHMGLLNEDIEKGETDNAKKTAHMIKGSSLNMTAQRLANAARKIELSGESVSPAQLKDLLADLKNEFLLLKVCLAEEGMN